LVWLDRAPVRASLFERPEARGLTSERGERTTTNPHTWSLHGHYTGFTKLGIDRRSLYEEARKSLLFLAERVAHRAGFGTYSANPLILFNILYRSQTARIPSRATSPRPKFVNS
jgi:hypothetical protein